MLFFFFLVKGQEETCWIFLPQCSRNSSWKELSSSWISSGQGQSSPALKFNRMLICRKERGKKMIRLEELRLGKGIEKNVLESMRDNNHCFTQVWERMNKRRMGKQSVGERQKGQQHYYSETHSAAGLLMWSPVANAYMGFSDRVCLISADRHRLMCFSSSLVASTYQNFSSDSWSHRNFTD